MINERVVGLAEAGDADTGVWSPDSLARRIRRAIGSTHGPTSTDERFTTTELGLFPTVAQIQLEDTELWSPSHRGEIFARFLAAYLAELVDQEVDRRLRHLELENAELRDRIRELEKSRVLTFRLPDEYLDMEPEPS